MPLDDKDKEAILAMFGEALASPSFKTAITAAIDEKVKPLNDGLKALDEKVKAVKPADEPPAGNGKKR